MTAPVAPELVLFPPGESDTHLIRRAAEAMQYAAQSPFDRAAANLLNIAAETTDALVREEAVNMARAFVVAYDERAALPSATRATEPVTA